MTLLSHGRNLGSIPNDSIMIQRQFFTCQCEHLDHQFILSTYDYSDEKDLLPDDQLMLELSVHLVNYSSFWYRLWAAIKYLWNRPAKTGHFDSVILKDGDVEALLVVLNNYQQKMEKLKNPSIS